LNIILMDDKETYIRNLGRSLAEGLIESDGFRSRIRAKPINSVYLYGTNIDNLIAISQYMQERLEEREDNDPNLFDLAHKVQILLGSSFELPRDVGDDVSFSEYPINLSSYFDEFGLPVRVNSSEGQSRLKTL